MLPIKQQDTNNQKFLNSKAIHSFYKLSPRSLETKLNTLRKNIIEEFDDFKQKLLGMLSHLNYIRYMKSHPNDDIRFIFRDKSTTSSLSQQGLELKEQILTRMNLFNTIRDDNTGLSTNCEWEIQKMLGGDRKILNFKQICPSAVTFLESHEQIASKFMPFWKFRDSQESDLSDIFKEISPTFPEQDVKKLGSIFSAANKAVLSARLIFRASEHNFQSAMFKEICSGRSNTLLIAKSEKDMVFGGFTPCKWLKTKQKQYIGDPSGQSFLFSLSHNIVFPIKKNQLDYAISAYGGWGPIYGSPYGPDLSISDKCHLNDHSCSSLGSHYQIPTRIKQYSNEAFSLLAGAKKFKVLEYEVYELSLN